MIIGELNVPPMGKSVLAARGGRVKIVDDPMIRSLRPRSGKDASRRVRGGAGVIVAFLNNWGTP